METMLKDALEMGVSCMESIRELGHNFKLLSQEFSVTEKRRSNQLEQLTNELFNAVEIIKSNKEMITNQQREIQKLQGQLNGKDITIKELRSRYKELEIDLMKLELQHSNSLIRIRNFPEHENGKMTEFETWLSKETDMETKGKIEYIQRRNSNYSKINKIPRDIMIKCRTKVDRDGILHKLDQKTRIFNGKPVQVICEVPFRIRSRRKQYKDFTNLLRTNHIQYRWILPEGLNFSFKTQSYNINSTESIQKFLSEHGRELTEGHSPKRHTMEKNVPEREKPVTKKWRAKEERRNDLPTMESMVPGEEQIEYNKLQSKEKEDTGIQKIEDKKEESRKEKGNKKGNNTWKMKNNKSRAKNKKKT